ncbi:hypothetical protein ACJX0J_011911, partial [Zea mays]
SFVFIFLRTNSKCVEDESVLADNFFAITVYVTLHLSHPFEVVGLSYNLSTSTLGVNGKCLFVFSGTLSYVITFLVGFLLGLLGLILRARSVAIHILIIINDVKELKYENTIKPALEVGNKEDLQHHLIFSPSLLIASNEHLDGARDLPPMKKPIESTQITQAQQKWAAFLFIDRIYIKILY